MKVPDPYVSPFTWRYGTPEMRQIWSEVEARRLYRRTCQLGVAAGCHNEAVMMGLRTRWGVSLTKVREEFGPNYEAYLKRQAAPYLRDQLLFLDDDTLYTARKGKFLVDGIASDLFMINLK